MNDKADDLGDPILTDYVPGDQVTEIWQTFNEWISQVYKSTELMPIKATNIYSCLSCQSSITLKNIISKVFIHNFIPTAFIKFSSLFITI